MSKKHKRIRVTVNKFIAIQQTQSKINKCKKMFSGQDIFKFGKNEEYKACFLCSKIFNIGKIYILKGMHGFDFCTTKIKNGEIKSSRKKKYKTKIGYPRGVYEFDKRHIVEKVEKTKEIDAFLFSKIDDKTSDVIQLIYIEKPSAVKKVHDILNKRQKEFEELSKVKNIQRQSIWIYDDDIIGKFDPDDYYLATEEDLLCYRTELEKNILHEIITF
ncbi:MAG: hypothetical protein ACOC5T_07450 [Elusimicrobiota bacterium]